ncbi:MAG: adenylate/guanylate cyclase domain-containing protein [Chloroflexi bacterium]|nr:adenylate/guanylate cyclase domain-containing protein [Chloroflexota bacterium]
MESSIRSTNSRRQVIIILIILIILTVTEVAGYIPGVTTPLERVELSVRDFSFRLRGESLPAEELVIVAIDDDSLGWVNEQWPWPRSRIAEIINWLTDAGARVIALDMFLFDPAPNEVDDDALVEAFRNANAIVSVNQIFGGEMTITHKPPLPIYQEVLDGYGITEIVRDDDAIVRGISAYKTFSGEVYYTWAFEIVRVYLGIDPPSDPSPAGLTFNGSFIPLNQRRVLLVNYAGPSGSFPTYSAAFVPLDEGDYPAELFRDKIVFIGATSETLQDLYPTPFSTTNLTPGVEIVANTVATLLNQDYLQLAPPWMNLAITVLAAFFAWGSNKIKRPSRAILVLAGIMSLYFILRFIAFTQLGWEFAIITPEAMLFLGVIVPTLEQAVTQEVEKRRVHSLFSRFISPEMVTQILDTHDIESLNKRAELTILFSDIRGFTTISEKLRPDELVALLNPYLEVMSSVIHKHGGTVDKFEGDAIVAFFGEPIPFSDHAKQAVSAALEMRTALQKLTSEWKSEQRFTDTFEMGVGLNTGEVFVGLLGSEQRINYTVIGDNVNLAARLQDQTKEFKWPILISGSTYEQVKDEFETEFLDSRLLKGKTETVNIYKLIGRLGSGPEEKVKTYSNI